MSFRTTTLWEASARKISCGPVRQVLTTRYGWSNFSLHSELGVAFSKLSSPTSTGTEAILGAASIASDAPRFLPAAGRLDAEPHNFARTPTIVMRPEGTWV